MPAREGVLNKIIVVIRVISDVIERDLFNPINLLNEPGLIFYVVLKIATVLNFDTRPFFIGQETSIVARLEHNPQTDKTTEMPRDKITLCFRSTA